MGCHNSVPVSLAPGAKPTQSNSNTPHKQDKTKIQPHSKFNNSDQNDSLYFNHVLAQHIDEYKKCTNQQKNIVSHEVYSSVLQLFQKLFLTKNKKIELFELIKKYLDVNFGNQKQDDQKLFCQQMSEKISQLKERVHQKNKQCLLYWANTMQTNTRGFLYQCKYDLSEEETLKIGQKTRVYCNKDLDSFAFITLYLQVSLKRFIKDHNLIDSQQILLKTLQTLQKKYPANEQDEQNFKTTYQNLESFSNQKSYQKFIFTFQKKSHYEQLTDFIILKATQAKSDQALFKQMVKDCCSQFGGYSLKTGLKIKSKQNKASIFRTIQKLVDKKIYQKKFLEEKQNYKNQVIQRSKAQPIDLDNIVQNQMSAVKKRIQKILQQQKQIQFDAKDLLRGKCIFDKIQEILHTAKRLLKNLQEKGLKVLQIKNRLMKKTKDITLIIEFPHSIAQLQLVLKLDSVANQFNHKIYELLRSTLYSPITNLFVLGKKWGQTFFGQMLRNYEYMHRVNKDQKFFDGFGFKDFEPDVQKFTKQYLATILPNEMQTNDSLKEQNEELNAKNCQVLTILQSNKKYQNVDVMKRKDNQAVNNAKFAHNILSSDLIISQISLLTQEKLQANDGEMLQINGDLLNQKLKYSESTAEYDKVISIIERKPNTCTQRMAHIYEKKAINYRFNLLIKDENQRFGGSILNFNSCLQIKKKLYGKNHLSVAKTLSDIGQIYYLIKDYQNSIKFYKQAEQIQQKLIQKQSYQKASTYSSLSNIYLKLGNQDKSLEYNQKAAGCYKKIGLVSGSKQEYQKSLSFFTQSSNQLSSIGTLYLKKKQYKKALAAYMKCLQIRQKIIGKMDLGSAGTFTDIAVTYQGMGQPRKAIQYYKKSLAYFQNHWGKQHHMNSYNYYSLSVVHESIGQLEAAEDYASRAYENTKKQFGEQHANTKKYLLQLTNVRKKIQQKKINPTLYQGNQSKTCQC